MKIRSFFKENDYVVLSFLICFFGGYFLMSAKINAEESWERYNEGIKLVKLAEKGDASSLYELSYVYYNGEEVAQDKKKAHFWMQKVAEDGDPQAQFVTGLNYALEHDYKEAVKWYTIAELNNYDFRADGTNGNLNIIKLAKGHLSPAQIAEAQELAREWIDKHQNN